MEAAREPQPDRGADGIQRRGEHRSGGAGFCVPSAGETRDRGGQQQRRRHCGGSRGGGSDHHYRDETGLRMVRVPLPDGGLRAAGHGTDAAVRRGHDFPGVRHRQIPGLYSARGDRQRNPDCRTAPRAENAADDVHVLWEFLRGQAAGGETYRAGNVYGRGYDLQAVPERGAAEAAAAPESRGQPRVQRPFSGCRARSRVPYRGMPGDVPQPGGGEQGRQPEQLEGADGGAADDRGAGSRMAGAQEMSYFESRFRFDPRREVLWKALCDYYFSALVPPGGHVLELGAGTGVCAAGYAHAGVDYALLTDLEPRAVANMQCNIAAVRRPRAARVETRVLDAREVGAVTRVARERAVDTVVAADVNYDEEVAACMAEAVAAVVRGGGGECGGVVVVTERNEGGAARMRRRLQDGGVRVEEVECVDAGKGLEYLGGWELSRVRVYRVWKAS